MKKEYWIYAGVALIALLLWKKSQAAGAATTGGSTVASTVGQVS